jgi:hypothetical protein
VSANVDHISNYDTTEIVSGRRKNRRQFDAQLDESVCDHETRLLNQQSVAVECCVRDTGANCAAHVTEFINASRSYELLHLTDDVDGGPSGIFSKRSYLLV